MINGELLIAYCDFFFEKRKLNYDFL